MYTSAPARIHTCLIIENRGLITFGDSGLDFSALVNDGMVADAVLFLNKGFRESIFSVGGA